MKIAVEKRIQGSKEEVWRVLTDIEHSADNISGIEKIEILEPAKEGIVGLKWRETRLMFGKEATEVMWITDAREHEFYQTRAESHGSIYKSGFQIRENGDACIVTMFFDGEAVSLGAKISNFVFSGMMKKSMIKAVEVDLEDIKRAVEG